MKKGCRQDQYRISALLALSCIGACLGMSVVQAAETEPTDFASAVQSIRADIDARIPTLSNPRHAPQLLSHGEKRPCAVVITHGTYESPHYVEGISKKFFSVGCNVYSILLPGHWDRDLRSMDQTVYTQWIDEHERAVKKAAFLGDHLVLSGFSIGGLLSIRYGLEHPEAVSSLAVWAPALKETVLTEIGTWAGSLTGLDPGAVIGKSEDGYDRAYISANAGVIVADVEQEMVSRFATADHGDFKSEKARASVYRQLQVPTFVAYTRMDQVISASEVDLFLANFQGKKDVLYYPWRAHLLHGAVAKTPTDVFSDLPNSYNPDYVNMLERSSAFVLRHLAH